MKHKRPLTFGLLFLLTLSQLFAQQQNPRITLKAGDWFKTEIRIASTAHTSDYKFDVKYELVQKTPNGNLVFKVSIERMRLKYADSANNWMGYDSFYPRYIEGRKKGLSQQVYEITTNNQGKIAKLTTSSTAQKFSYSLISVRTNFAAPKAEFSFESILPAIQVKKISEILISSLVNGKRLPKTFTLPNTHNIATALLRSASFELRANALIKGRITNRVAIDTIYAFDNKIFKFHKDGSFSAPVLATSDPGQRWIFGQFDEYKTFSIHLEPFDTLIVNADRSNFDKTLSFAGSAAAKASLSKELTPIFNNQWVNESGYRKQSIEEFLSFQKKGQKEFDDIISKYTNRVPSEILNENKANFKYNQAGTKLQFFEHNRSGLKPKMSMEDFPKDFFVSIDTLPVAMSNLESGLFYNYYVTWLLAYKQTRLGMANASQHGFQANYATALASFDGFPLHFSIYNSLRNELHKSEAESTERLKNYYEDFINNCGDTTAVNRVKEDWVQARKWLPGNPSPLRKLTGRGESDLQLDWYKGKPLVLIVNNNSTDVLKDYIDLIKKQRGKKVHFIIAQSMPGVAQISTVEELKSLPNVSYLEINMDENTRKTFKLHYLQTKVFTFTPETRVISSQLIGDIPGEPKSDKAETRQIIEEMIKKAVESGVMTKEQKAELIKTIGWSVGSILFASLIFFWIYRARVANLKRKETLRRQIKELEVKAIRSQMNPHFIFNALNSIQSLINDEQYQEANIYLEKFAVLMRRVLNNSEKTFISLSDELQAVTLYAELEQLRFDFVFDIKIDQDINTDMIEIPGMITQPLIENAILHGIAQKGKSGTLKVDISKEGAYLKIIICDNGSGWDGMESPGHSGFGLKLVRERLNLLNTATTKGKLEINSNLAGQESGLTAVLTIPVD